MPAVELQASVRREACQFIDTRLSDPQKVAFMHQVLQRDMAEVRMFLGNLERFASSIGPVQRVAPATAAAFAAIAGATTSRAGATSRRRATPMNLRCAHG